ncbi:MAG: hypothetical protein ACE5FD_12550 [Anaerolineae bacterium]
MPGVQEETPEPDRVAGVSVRAIFVDEGGRLRTYPGSKSHYLAREGQTSKAAASAGLVHENKFPHHNGRNFIIISNHNKTMAKF